jgi:hypothetical protein
MALGRGRTAGTVGLFPRLSARRKKDQPAGFYLQASGTGPTTRMACRRAIRLRGTHAQLRAFKSGFRDPVSVSTPPLDAVVKTNSQRRDIAEAMLVNSLGRGYSSFGRAPPWHGGGEGFESP